MNILITGVCGFIGSHLARTLLEIGHNVVGVDISTDHQRILDLIPNRMFKIHHQDLSKVESCDFVFRKNNNFDMIFHLASNTDENAGRSNPDVDFDNTLRATYNMLCHAVKYNVDIFSMVGILSDKSKNLKSWNDLQNMLLNNFSYKYGLKGFIFNTDEVIGKGARDNSFLKSMILKVKQNPDKIACRAEGERFYIHVSDLIHTMLSVISESNVSSGKVLSTNLDKKELKISDKEVINMILKELCSTTELICAEENVVDDTSSDSTDWYSAYNTAEDIIRQGFLEI